MARNATWSFLVAGALTLAAPRMAAAPTTDEPDAEPQASAEHPEEKSEAVKAEGGDDRDDDGAGEKMEKKSKASEKRAEPSPD